MLKHLLLVPLAALILTGCSAVRQPAVSPAPSPVTEDVGTESDALMQGDLEETDAEVMLPDTDTRKTIQLDEQNESGQRGTAVLEEEDGQVTVTLRLTGGNFTQPQPAHIHLGTCDMPGKVTHPLQNVSGGNSVTTIESTLDEIMAVGTSLIVNVHKSAAESNVYTACGTLK